MALGPIKTEVETMLYIVAYVVFAVLVAIICIQGTRIHELKQDLLRQSNDEIPVKIVPRIPTPSPQVAVDNYDGSSIPEDTAALVENIIRITS